MTALALMIALLVQDPPPPPAPPEKPQAKEDEQLKELKDLWSQVVDLCRQEKKEEIQKAIAAMEMTREEMVALFGEEKTAKVHPRYQETWKGVLKEAADDLIARCKKSAWDEVEVWCINTRDEKDLAGADKGVLGALANKDAKVYNIRLKKKGQKDGFVLRCFVKTKDGWRMGLKLGSALAEK